MKDILGIEIKIGDFVAYSDPGYAEARVGVVVGFMP